MRVLTERTPSTRAKLCVLLPTHNGQAYLEETLKALEEGLPSNARVVVADDASEDDSWRILQAWSTTSRLSISLHRSESRVGLTRNLLFMRTAVGSHDDYVLLMAQDDLISRDMVHHALALAERSGALVVVPTAKLINEHSSHVGTRVPVLLRPRWLFIVGLMSTNGIVGPGSIVRRQAFLQATDHMTDDLVQDWELWLRLAPMGKFRWNRRGHIKYRVHARSLSRSADSGTYVIARARAARTGFESLASSMNSPLLQFVAGHILRTAESRATGVCASSTGVLRRRTADGKTGIRETLDFIPFLQLQRLARTLGVYAIVARDVLVSVRKCGRL